ncbi:hypothetical protein [Aeromicrobium endophyticum]|uniref:Uncharacterized protein n=1 Tax=Aeromicrobium endophyticum TaxID=2292704 RepID=A0A371PAZ5_9ACTN|nr:hypothetical protein [Aeromicrobium endophyticum]REK73081.1 hypothetical protein DX116_05725 [Aeromicrobium endophyticum]
MGGIISAGQPTDSPSIFELGGEIVLDSHESVRLHHTRGRDSRRIAVHDTRLGPALGGTRFYPYANDPLRLLEPDGVLAEDAEARAR